MQLMAPQPAKSLYIDGGSVGRGCGNHSVYSIVPVGNVTDKGRAKNSYRYCPEMIDQVFCEFIHFFVLFNFVSAVIVLYTQRMNLSGSVETNADH
jgi:hypothetical protein